MFPESTKVDETKVCDNIIRPYIRVVVFRICCDISGSRKNKHQIFSTQSNISRIVKLASQKHEVDR
jgi:hypothetical protein